MATRLDRLSAWLRRNARQLHQIEISLLDVDNQPAIIAVVDDALIKELKIGEELAEHIIGEAQSNCDAAEGPGRYQVAIKNTEKLVATFMLKLEPSEGPNDPLDIGSSAAVSSGSQLIRTIEAMIRMTVSMHMNQQRAYQQIIQEQRREITELRSRERDIQSTAHRIMTQQIADIREESPPNPALEKLVALGEKLAPMIIDRVTTPGAEE